MTQVTVAAGVHHELLADNELRQHDEGEWLEEGVVLRSAQGRRVGGDVRHRVSGLDEPVGFGNQPEAVQAVVLNGDLTDQRTAGRVVFAERVEVGGDGRLGPARPAGVGDGGVGDRRFRSCTA